MSRPRECRAIADNCAAYTGATCFRQCRGLSQLQFFETSQLGRIYLFSRGFYGRAGGASGHWNRPTLAIGNLTGPGAKRILGISVLAIGVGPDFYRTGTENRVIR